MYLSHAIGILRQQREGPTKAVKGCMELLLVVERTSSAIVCLRMLLLHRVAEIRRLADGGESVEYCGLVAVQIEIGDRSVAEKV